MQDSPLQNLLDFSFQHRYNLYMILDGDGSQFKAGETEFLPKTRFLSDVPIWGCSETGQPFDLILATTRRNQ